MITSTFLLACKCFTSIYLLAWTCSLLLFVGMETFTSISLLAWQRFTTISLLAWKHFTSISLLAWTIGHDQFYFFDGWKYFTFISLLAWKCFTSFISFAKNSHIISPGYVRFRLIRSWRRIICFLLRLSHSCIQAFQWIISNSMQTFSFQVCDIFFSMYKDNFCAWEEGSFYLRKLSIPGKKFKPKETFHNGTG